MTKEVQWNKDKHPRCGKIKDFYRIILYDNYEDPQIINPDTEIEFVAGQREHIVAWCEIPVFKG